MCMTLCLFTRMDSLSDLLLVLGLRDHFISVCYFFYRRLLSGNHTRAETESRAKRDLEL